jgi:Xaa-Pro aminopeptidase
MRKEGNAITITISGAATTLAADRLARLRGRLAAAPFDAVVLIAPANVHYASSYRSVGAAVHGTASIAAIVTQDSLLLAGPAADSAPAAENGLPERDFLSYGRFYIESAPGDSPLTAVADQHANLAEAVSTALRHLGLSGAAIGLDQVPGVGELRASVAAALPGVRWADAAAWMSVTRGRKLPGEVDLLERAAQLAEDSILRALEPATVGITERDLARLVGGTMVDAGAEPRFVVVTSGPRSALADAYATDRAIASGDLVRFDVGCTLDGYWSDIGRTAVVGKPDARQRSLYAAILAGEQAQFDIARPGVAAGAVFRRAIEVVEASGGPAPYRRHHCGHGIGLTPYEPPIVRPDEDGELEPGMVFCFETPYYELGWGGMMVEDTLVITEDGCRVFTGRNRDLIEVPA